jgi:hypothetical protein
MDLADKKFLLDLPQDFHHEEIVHLQFRLIRDANPPRTTGGKTDIIGLPMKIRYLPLFLVAGLAMFAVPSWADDDKNQSEKGGTLLLQLPPPTTVQSPDTWPTKQSPKKTTTQPQTATIAKPAAKTTTPPAAKAPLPPTSAVVAKTPLSKVPISPPPVAPPALNLANAMAHAGGSHQTYQVDGSTVVFQSFLSNTAPNIPSGEDVEHNNFYGITLYRGIPDDIDGSDYHVLGFIHVKDLKYKDESYKLAASAALSNGGQAIIPAPPEDILYNKMTGRLPAETAYTDTYAWVLRKN